jgi:hypothetical protein
MVAGGQYRRDRQPDTTSLRIVEEGMPVNTKAAVAA